MEKYFPIIIKANKERTGELKRLRLFFLFVSSKVPQKFIFAKNWQILIVIRYSHKARARQPRRFQSSYQNSFLQKSWEI
jgi:hypothetical protein